jgi:hypothetical protein
MNKPIRMIPQHKKPFMVKLKVHKQQVEEVIAQCILNVDNSCKYWII